MGPYVSLLFLMCPFGCFEIPMRPYGLVGAYGSSWVLTVLMCHYGSFKVIMRL